MQLARPTFALDPKLFGRGRVREVATPDTVRTELCGDLRLFATTFAAGFLFVSILIG